MTVSFSIVVNYKYGHIVMIVITCNKFKIIKKRSYYRGIKSLLTFLDVLPEQKKLQVYLN